MSLGIIDVLGTFSANQLRDLALAMETRGMEIPKRQLPKEGLLELFESKKSDSTLALFAHRIEAITPYKHLFIYSLDSKQLDYSKAKRRIDAAFPNLIGSVRKVDPHVGDLAPEACLADETQKRIYLKLVHQVEMSGWVTVSRTEKKLKEFRKRHPVVIIIRPADGILTIGFPGFTYVSGMQREERIAYSAIAAQGVEFLRNKLRIEPASFNAKPAIDALLEGEPNEVVEIKRNVRPLKGGRFAFDAGEEGKVASALTDFLRLEGDISVSEPQIRNLLRRSGASDIVLIWKRLQILTRIALLQDGPEILFVWRDSGPSSETVDSVLRKITSYERVFAKPSTNAVRKKLLAAPIGQVIRPAMIAQEHGISAIEVVEILNNAVVSGNFEPRFCVNTDALLVDFRNTWRTDLAEFPNTAEDENGNVLDLTNPSNIEVAFERVK